jgi:hypothetical protein
MKTLGTQLTTTTRHVVGSWITWVVLGAAATTGALFSTGFLAPEDAQGVAPSGLEIEAAVAQAEAQANTARSAQVDSGGS